MTKPASNSFIAEKNKTANSPIFLYTVHDYDGLGNNLYFAEWDADVVFNSITYTRFAIKHNFIKSNGNGQIDAIQVTLGNASRQIQAYLEAYDLHNVKVDITVVFSNLLADATAFVKETFYIESYTADDSNVTFNLSTKFDINELELPNRRYMRTYCAWQFKGTECKYAGATATCNKTEAACKAMAGGSNIINYGGFPGIPTSQIFLA